MTDTEKSIRETATMAVAVSLAPSVGAGDPRKDGIHRWLADGGRARFIACTPVYLNISDGEPVIGHTLVFDMTNRADDALAGEYVSDCHDFVSYNPDRDLACLPVFVGKRHWMSLAAHARYKALPSTPEGLARALKVEYPAEAVAELDVPPDGLTGDGGRAAAMAVSMMHAKMLAALHARGMAEFPHGYERNIERMTQRMNIEGVGVDLHLVRVMAEARRVLLAKYIARFREMTGFNPGQRKNLLGWLRNRGFGVGSLDKASMRALKATLQVVLEEPGRTGERTEAAAREVTEALFLYNECGCITLSKLDTLERRASDGRVRGHLVYYGAHTGRWSAEGVQLQNFPRPGLRMEEGVAALLAGGKAGAADALVAFAAQVGVPPLAYLQTLLRGVLTDSHNLAWFDFAQIEARILARCAQEHDLLAMFIRGNAGDPEHDIYVDMAARVLEIESSEVTREQRNRIGKPAILGCGFGLSEDGAAKHDQFMHVDEHLARKAVRNYRAAYPGVVTLWKRLEGAARFAVAGSPASFDMGGEKDVEWGVRFSAVEVTPDEMRIKMEIATGCVVNEMYFPADRANRGWLMGHKLVENMVSRIARDCVAHVMMELEEQGFVPLHVNHDEPIFRAQAGLEEALPAAFRKVEIRFRLPEGTLSFEYNTALRYSK